MSFLPEDQSLYIIGLLHSLRDQPGIAKLHGVVVDSTGRYLKSYLMKNIAQVWMFNTISRTAVDIPWPRKERWAKRLVETVTMVHSRGFVIGNLGFATDYLLDDDDLPILWTFQNKIWKGQRVIGYLPPEDRINGFQYRDGTWIIPGKDFVRVTPGFDVYHLGMLLVGECWGVRDSSQTDFIQRLLLRYRSF